MWEHHAPHAVHYKSSEKITWIQISRTSWDSYTSRSKSRKGWFTSCTECQTAFPASVASEVVFCFSILPLRENQGFYVHQWLNLTIILPGRFHYSHFTDKQELNTFPSQLNHQDPGLMVYLIPKWCSSRPCYLGDITDALWSVLRPTESKQVGSSFHLGSVTSNNWWSLNLISSSVIKKRSFLKTLNLIILSLFPLFYVLSFPIPPSSSPPPNMAQNVLVHLYF